MAENKLLKIILAVVLMLCLCIFSTGCSFISFSEKGDSDTQETHFYREGFYLKSVSGSDIIIIDAEGENAAFPCVMTAASDEVTFDGLDDGDRIKIEISLIAETYPGQTNVYSIEKLSDGVLDDIGEEIIKILVEYGYLSDDTESETGLFITDIEDWDKISEYAAPACREYISDMLSGKTACIENVVFGDYKISVDSQRYGVTFEVSVLESDVDTLPIGKNSFYISDLDGIIPIIQYNNEIPAFNQLKMYLCNSPTYSINAGDDGVQRAMTVYILGLKQQNSSDDDSYWYAKDEIAYFADACFGISDFTPEGAETGEKGYKRETVGGFGWSYRMISSTEENGLIKIRVRYYADLSQFLPSDLVEYTFDSEVKDSVAGHRFISSEVVETGKYRPYISAV